VPGRSSTARHCSRGHSTRPRPLRARMPWPALGCPRWLPGCLRLRAWARERTSPPTPAEHRPTRLHSGCLLLSLCASWHPPLHPAFASRLSIPPLDPAGCHAPPRRRPLHIPRRSHGRPHQKTCLATYYGTRPSPTTRHRICCPLARCEAGVITIRLPLAAAACLQRIAPALLLVAGSEAS
jgi:hypothetical protein